MWRFLHRHHVKLFCRRNGAMPFAILIVVVAVCLVGLTDAARAQDDLSSITGKAGQLIIIREHAGWNMRCEPVAHPALYLSEPPSHGNVCARIENIKISSMYVGTESQCVGRLVRGVQLVYRPDATYAGDDDLRYDVQYPSVLRTIAVKLTVTVPPSAVPSNIVAPIPQTRQLPGPVPICADPIF